jgi:hypothetical protein
VRKVEENTPSKVHMGQVQWLMSVILTTWKAEAGGSEFEAGLGKSTTN